MTRNVVLCKGPALQKRKTQKQTNGGHRESGGWGEGVWPVFRLASGSQARWGLR